jgi:hypothetical protein
MTEAENITVYREFILPSHGKVGKRGWTKPKQRKFKFPLSYLTSLHTGYLFLAPPGANQNTGGGPPRS